MKATILGSPSSLKKILCAFRSQDTFGFRYKSDQVLVQFKSVIRTRISGCFSPASKDIKRQKII